MTINLVSVLVGLLIWGLIGWGVNYALSYFGAPQPVRMIVMCILLIVFILWLLGELGLGLGSGPVVRVGDLGWYVTRLLS